MTVQDTLKLPSKKKRQPKQGKSLDQQIRDKYPAPPGRAIFRIKKVNDKHIRITYHIPDTWTVGPSFWINTDTLEVPEDHEVDFRKYQRMMKKI